MFYTTRFTTVLVALAMAGTAYATADGPDYYRVTGVDKGDTLNIRVAPNANADKIGEIPPDSNCIRNLGCQGGLTMEEFTTMSKEQQQKRQKENPRWCKVEFNAITGWVAGRFLEEGDCEASAGKKGSGTKKMQAAENKEPSFDYTKTTGEAEMMRQGNKFCLVNVNRIQSSKNKDGS